MKFKASDSRTGNQLLLLFCIFWLAGYWMKFIEFAWLFILLGFMNAIVYHVDRIVNRGRNWELEANVPNALTLLVNVLLFICVLLALREFVLALMSR